jgi:hypothetical protein
MTSPRSFRPDPNQPNIHDYSTGEMPSPDEEQWDTTALMRDFEVNGFMAPFVMVTRRSDGAKGTLQFNHNPRVYFSWEPV